jgi:hypothetical protein
LVENGLAIPKPPLWGKNNDPKEWWSTNDFEILFAAYRHEVEGFLRIVAPYFPRGPKDIDYSEHVPLPVVVNIPIYSPFSHLFKSLLPF